MPKKKSPPVQPTLDRLVWRHGRNLRERADRDELLRAEGLDPTAIPERAWEHALESARQRVLSEEGGLHWEEAPREDWGVSLARIWRTRCGRYRVVHVQSRYGLGSYFGVEWREGTSWVAERNPDSQHYAPLTHKTARLAFEAAEKLYCKHEGLASVRSNSRIFWDTPSPGTDKILSSTGTQAGDPADNDLEETTVTTTATKTLTVNETAVREALTAAGIHAAKDWTRVRLLKKIRDLSSLKLGDVEEPHKALLDSILEAGEAVALEPSEEPAPALEPEKPAPKKGRGKGTPAKKGEAKPAPKTQGAKGKAEGNGHAPKTKRGKAEPTTDDRDWYGSRPGTGTFAINAALTSKPKELAALATETGLEAGRIRSHLYTLKGKGFVTQSDKGWALVKK